ncbi:hypothetical protein Taro_000950 [Colocasia esculenta]|uniref:Uncharacterized protein n=1 Tax=Colocasia esculenta TaxID=4460 RepID=A0A843TCA3_COLES|nr:hypothetical protein [Colocasia esculenta]
MVILGDLGEGPSVPLHPESAAGTLSLGCPPLPLDPSKGFCGPAAPIPFHSNKSLDPFPEPSVNIKPTLDSRVGSSESPFPSRKKKGSGIPRRYLLDLVQRCGTLLAIEEFVQEAVTLNIEAQHEEKGLDDGFGVYEILAEDDPLDEDDCEIEDAAEMRGGGPCVVSRRRGACVELGGGVLSNEKGPTGFGSSFEMEHPLVCLPTDVVAAVRVATSVEASPRQQFSVVLVVLPRQFSRCLALEGLSRSEVVSISKDPHPREPVDGGIQAMSMLDSVSPFAGVEAGARLVSRVCADCGSPSWLLAEVAWLLLLPVLLVVPASVFSRFRGPILGCQPVMALACVASRPGGVSGVWGGVLSTASALCPTPFISVGVVCLVREAHPPYFLQLGARRRGSSVSDGLRRRLWHRVVVSRSESDYCELLYPSELRVVFCKSSGATLGIPGEGSERSGRYSGVRLPCMILAHAAGCSCCCVACEASVIARCVRAVGARLVLDSLAVVFLVWRTLASQSNLALTGCELWLSLRSAVGLAGAFWRVFPERRLGGSGGGSLRTGLRSSHDRPLSLLVEVLPKSAS